MSDDNIDKSFWRNDGPGNSILVFLAGVFTTVVGFYSGILNNEIKNKEVDVEAMRVAVDVLKSPKEQTGDEYRRWACEVLKTKSGQEIDCKDPATIDAGIAPTKEDTMSRDSFTIFSGNASGVDVAIFTCGSSDQATSVRLAKSLDQKGFGIIRQEPWSEATGLSAAQVNGAQSIVFDKTHGEAAYIDQISSSITEISEEKVQRIANSDRLTPWYVSVFLCLDGTTATAD